MEERDKVRVEKQKKRRDRGLNLNHPGNKPMSYPIHHEDLMQNTAFCLDLSFIFVNFCLETRANLETSPSK